jgi:hypothetical protein
MVAVFWQVPGNPGGRTNLSQSVPTSCFLRVPKVSKGPTHTCCVAEKLRAHGVPVLGHLLHLVLLLWDHCRYINYQGKMASLQFWLSPPSRDPQVCAKHTPPSFTQGLTRSAQQRERNIRRDCLPSSHNRAGGDV